MSDAAPPFATLAAIARQLASGEVSSTELTESYLRRIEAMDDKLNAFRMVTGDRAMDAAAAADKLRARGQTLGPLHGIPYAAKDLYDVAGLPTSAGAKVLETNIAERNCRTVDDLQAAGMVLLGKTNTVQFAYGGVGVNHDHGTPHNPWSETLHDLVVPAVVPVLRSHRAWRQWPLARIPGVASVSHRRCAASAG